MLQRLPEVRFFSLTAKYVHSFDVFSLKSGSQMRSKARVSCFCRFQGSPWMAFDTSGRANDAKTPLFQRPKRRYFAEILAFATLGRVWRKFPAFGNERCYRSEAFMFSGRYT